MRHTTKGGVERYASGCFNCSRRSSLRHGQPDLPAVRNRYCFNCSRRSSLRHPLARRHGRGRCRVSTAPEGAHCGTRQASRRRSAERFQLLPKELIAAQLHSRSAGRAAFQLLPKELIAARGDLSFDVSDQVSTAPEGAHCGTTRSRPLPIGGTRSTFQLLPKELIAAPLIYEGVPLLHGSFNCSRRSSLRHERHLLRPWWPRVSTAPEGAHCGTAIVGEAGEGHAFQLLPKELIAALYILATNCADEGFNCSRRSSLRHILQRPSGRIASVSTAPEGAHCGTKDQGP